MANYTGEKCYSCGFEFTDTDDIVVCPDCGTPYHRSCYAEHGKCINEELHESGGSWSSVGSDSVHIESQENENIRCPRCGAENTSEKLFCDKCGMPLIVPEKPLGFNEHLQSGDNGEQGESSNFAQGMGRMVFDQNTVVEGVTLGDYARYIGINPVPMLAKFVRFGRFGGKFSINFFAFFFPHIYFFFRKMKGWGVLFLMLTAILAVPSVMSVLASGRAGYTITFGFDLTADLFKRIYTVCSDLNFGLQILAGVFANYIYYKQANRDIKAIRKKYGENDDDKAVQEIHRKGGISWAGAILGFTLYMAIVFGLVFGAAYFKIKL